MLDEFVANPKLSNLKNCKKPVLLAITKYYSVPVASSPHEDKLRVVVTRDLHDLRVLVTSVDNNAAVEVGALVVTPDGAEHSDALFGYDPYTCHGALVQVAKSEDIRPRCLI